MTVREALFGWLRDRPSPVLVFPDHTIPAASLWVVMRQWVDAFRSQQVTAGVPIAFALPCSPGAVAAWLAAAWEDLPVVLPGHRIYSALDVRCEPGGVFELDRDWLLPRTRAVDVPIDTQLPPGVHSAAGCVTWPELFSGARPADTVELNGATWTTLAQLQDLGRALAGADIIRFAG